MTADIHSHFNRCRTLPFFAHSTDSIEKLKLDLALENQTADLFGKKETLEGSKKQKSECKTHTSDK
jgi:hypothetical protein